MDLARPLALFGMAAVVEIGGAYLVWQAVREGRGWALAVLGAWRFSHMALSPLQPDPHFGRILAAYGGVFVIRSLAWGVVFDGFRLDKNLVSHHLRALREAGLARSHRDHKIVFYSLTEAGCDLLRSLLQETAGAPA